MVSDLFIAARAQKLPPCARAKVIKLSIGFNIMALQPYKLTPEVITKIADGLRIGMTFEAAVRLGGITRKTLDLWRAAAVNQPENALFQQLTEALELALAEGQQVLLERMHGHSKGVQRGANGKLMKDIGDANATRWLLEARHKMKPESRVDITSAGQPVKYVISIPVVDRIGGLADSSINQLADRNADD